MVELTKGRRKKLAKFATKFGVEIDTVDCTAYWDSSLTDGEAMSIVKDEILKYAPADSEAMVERYMEGEDSRRHKEMQFEKQAIAENREQAFDIIKNSKNPTLDNYYMELRTFVRAVVTGDKVHSLFIVGEPGLGKTYQIIQELINHGKEFVVIQGNITPLQLYNKFCGKPDAIFVLDDTLPMIHNRQILALLYSAMWSPEGDRQIEWQSTTNKVNMEQAVFRGKIIFVLNQVPRENIEIRTLMSRCLSYTVRFNYQQKMEIIYALAKIVGKNEEEAKKNVELVNWIKAHTSEATSDLSLRTFFKVKQLVDTTEDWERMVLAMDGMGDNLAISVIQKLHGSGLRINEQIKTWCEETGLKRSMFYHYHRKYLELRR